MKITINKETLINKFMVPISKMVEKCVISLYPDHAQCLVTTHDTNPILYAYVKTTCDLGEEKEVCLNLPNINKLNRMLNCITSNEIDLEVNSNNIEYNSPNMKFKYHLLEDGVIDKTPISIEKIKNLKFDSDFIIDKDKAADIMKGTAFATDSNKLYFYTKDGKVYAELTDKEISNTDSVSYFITDEFSGTEIKTPILIDLEIFKLFYGLKDSIITKINTKNRVLLFKLEDTDYTLQYIVAPLTK